MRARTYNIRSHWTCKVIRRRIKHLFEYALWLLLSVLLDVQLTCRFDDAHVSLDRRFATTVEGSCLLFCLIIAKLIRLLQSRHHCFVRVYDISIEHRLTLASELFL